jgi:CubicO group peptidase (beta-lactamase class C family)
MTQAVYYPGISGDALGIADEALFNDFALSVTEGAGRYAYSNMGPELAARALARTTNQPFERAAQRLLLDPMEMAATRFRYHATPAASRAASYGSNRVRFAYEFETLPSAGAGAVSSLNDMARYAILHLTGRTPDGVPLLSVRQIEQLHSGPTAGFYGYGWGRIGADTPFEALISDGQVNGGQAMILLAPNRGVGVIVLANMASDAVKAFAVAAMEEAIPGFAAAFEQHLGALEQNHQAQLTRFTPESAWSGEGALYVGDQLLPINAANANGAFGAAFANSIFQGPPLGPQEGFARWEIPCPIVLQACAERNAHAEFHLTRASDGYDGVIVVTNALGLFPYRLSLR